MFRANRFNFEVFPLWKVSILVILFLFFAFQNTHSEISPGKEVTPEEHFERGMADYEAGNYRSAMENFSEVLFLDSTNKQAKRYLEKAGEKLLREAEAVRESEKKEILTKARSLFAQKREELKKEYREGLIHYKQGELLRAIHKFNGVLEIEPRHKKAKKYVELILKRLESIVNNKQFRSISELYYAQGAIHYINGDWTMAIAQWKDAVKFDPLNEELSEFVKIAEKKKEEAERLEKAEALYRYGVALYNEGKLDEAIGKLEESLRINPGHLRAQEYLVRTKEKIAAMRQEDEERKRRDVIAKHYFQGIDYYAEGEFSKAIKEWDEVLSLDPEHREAKEYKEKAKDKISIGAPVEKERKVALKGREEEKIETYYKQGINYYLAGEFREAIGQWQEVLRLEPSHKGAREYIAKAKERLKMTEEGVGEYSPYKEEIEEYVKELEKASPTDKEKEELIATHYQDGLIAYAHGDLSQAMKEWQIVLKLDPEHKKARRALIKLRAEMERRKGE